MNLDLRTLTVSEFLDRTFSIYRHRFLLFVALMAPQAVLSVAAALAFGLASASVATAKDFQFEKLIGLVIGAALGGVVFTGVHWVLYVLGVGATTAAVSDLYGGMAPDVGSAFRAAARRLGPMLWLTFLMMVRLSGCCWPARVVPGMLLRRRRRPDRVEGTSRPLAGGTSRPAGRPGRLLRRVRHRAVHGHALRGGDPGRGARADRRPRGDPALDPAHADLLGRVFLLMICGGFVSWAAAMVLQTPFIVAALSSSAPKRRWVSG